MKAISREQACSVLDSVYSEWKELKEGKDWALEGQGKLQGEDWEGPGEKARVDADKGMENTGPKAVEAGARERALGWRGVCSAGRGN